MAIPTKTNTASLYASNPTVSSSIGTSLSRPDGTQKVIFARIEESRCPSAIDFYGIVAKVVGSFHKISPLLSSSRPCEVCELGVKYPPAAQFLFA
jgi:hypothetical protein